MPPKKAEPKKNKRETKAADKVKAVKPKEPKPVSKRKSTSSSLRDGASLLRDATPRFR